jgi:lysyl-tRNA synthetase, class I
MTPSDVRAVAENSNAWPFKEARKVVERLTRRRETEVIFETGYGPSGLPHIGTFGEVARTAMVRHAFRVLTDDAIPTRLIAFSDDMDGLRKVPDNVPNPELLASHIGKALTRVPDPFGTHDSFGAHNNARLCAFLDRFDFEYELMSSTECYVAGRFDATLLRLLERYDDVMAIMLPSLRSERAQTYSPFLPIADDGTVLQVPVVARDASAGTITYEDPATGERATIPVTGGRCKLQWKPDWAMRWATLGVSYEMAGKDLIESMKLSGEICRVLGGVPPEGFAYELFLDENGQKISKSRGNGISLDSWLTYAHSESVSLCMYREPRAAKRLYFDVIPRTVDEYYQLLEAYNREQDPKKRLSNPVWHIHGGAPPAPDVPVSYTLLLNLVAASNADTADTLWGFVKRYRPGVARESHVELQRLVEYAIAYFRDFVAPTKRYRKPTDIERTALVDLRDALACMPAGATAEAIQSVVYDVGRRDAFLDTSGNAKAADGRPGVSIAWFELLYQVLLGLEKGPRFGSFVAIYGVDNTIALIDRAI